MTKLLCFILFTVLDLSFGAAAAATVTDTASPQHLEAADIGVHAALTNKTESSHPVIKSTLNQTRYGKSEAQPSRVNSSTQALSHVQPPRRTTTLSPSKTSYKLNTKSERQSRCQMHFQFRTLFIIDCKVTVRIKTCSGYCASSTSPVLRNYKSEKQVRLSPTCNCCRPVNLSSKTTTRKCNGKSVQITLPEMSGCACRPCILV